MKAMVLAAGRGERMLPLTLTTPKPALTVLGRPLALQVLMSLAEAGVDRAVMNLHHLPDALQELLGDGTAAGLQALDYSHEETIQGTGGGLRLAAPLLRGDGTVVVRNSDFLADVDLDAALEAHRASGRPATLVLAPHRPGYSVVETGADGAVLSLAGVPKSDPGKVRGRFLFTGLHLIEEEVLDRIPRAGPSDIVRHVYRDLATRGGLHGFVHEGFWWEFGTPQEYLEGSLRLLALTPAARRRVAVTDTVHVMGSSRVAVGPGVDIHAAGLELRGGVALGFASLIAEGATLEDTVVMPEAWIGPGTTLRRVIVGPGTEIPAGFHLENAVVCHDPGPEVALPPRTDRHDGLVVRHFEPEA